MSAGAIVAIIVAVVVVLLVIGALSVARRRKLQQRFGPEYDRVAGEKHSRRKANAELAERERRVRSLDIHPLDDTAQALDQLRHPAHQPPEDVVAEERDSERQAEAHLGLDVRERADSMERPDEDEEGNHRRHREHRGRRLLE